MRLTGFVAVSALLLAGCSAANESAADYESDTAEMQATEGAAAPADAAKEQASTTQIPVSKPQIAYDYNYGFRLPAASITKAQEAHIAMCRAMPQDGCRVLNMSNSGAEGDYANGLLELDVAAPKAQAFGGKLAAAVDEIGGDAIASSITGEDLSKQIVDTEARLRSRELLSQRLTELLRTKSGSVAELVEAERAVTQVNEEIDQARSWLKEMRGRVAYSKVTVNYSSSNVGEGGFIRPIRAAISEVGSIFGSSIAALVTFVAVMLPWLLIIGLIIWLRRKFKSRDRSFWGKKLEAAPPED